MNHLPLIRENLISLPPSIATAVSPIIFTFSGRPEGIGSMAAGSSPFLAWLFRKTIAPETNAVAKKQLYSKVKSMLGKLDMNPDHLIHRFAYMKNEIPVAGCAHQAGTCRFGGDPENSEPILLTWGDVAAE